MIYEVEGDMMLTRAQVIAHGVAVNDPMVRGFSRKLHERLKSRMEQIEVERRRLTQTKEEKLHALRSELLGLLERHEMVSFD